MAAYGKLIQIVKHATTTGVEYFEHKQETVPEYSSFQEYNVETFAIGFQEFLVCISTSLLVQGASKILAENLRLNRLQQFATLDVTNSFALSELRC